MLNYVEGLKIVLKSVNHLVYDGNGFTYEEVEKDNVVDILKRYGNEKLNGDTNTQRGMETLEYFVFDVYFTDESKPYLDEFMLSLGKSIDYCGYGVVNGIDSYNKAIEEGLTHFELEINNNCEYLYEVEHILKAVPTVCVAKGGVTYNIVAKPTNASIWRTDGKDCEGYCRVMYTETLDMMGLRGNSVLDSYVVLNGYTLLSNCVGKSLIGSKYINDDVEITYRTFKDMLYANIVFGGLSIA